MIKILKRALHEALNPVFGTNSKTVVILVDKDQSPPSWSLKEPALTDFESTKAVWGYPSSKTYERTLVLKIKNEDDIFKSACTAISSLKSRKIKDADIIFPKKFKEDNLIKWVNTAILKNYSYSNKTYSAEDEDSKESLVEMLFLDSKKEIDMDKFSRSIKSAQCALFSRDLVNTRGSEGTPYFIAQKAQEIYAKHKHKVDIEVIEGQKLADLGLNLLYNVGKGAICPPYLIVLKYVGNRQGGEFLSFVGKGVTFDTGGLNIKPTGSMEEMYLDKGGACATLSAFKWAVETQYPINLICTLAIAENAIGSN